MKNKIETIELAQTLWDTVRQEFLLRDSVDIIAAAFTIVQFHPWPGIYGIGYSVSPVDTGASIPYRTMLEMKGGFQVGDSLEYYDTFVDPDSVIIRPLCRYIITNCGDSIPSPTKGISNVEENCWPTRVDTSGTGQAMRNEEARFPDGWYDVFLKAWSHSGDTAAVHDTVYVDNFGGYATHVAAKLHTGSRDTTTFYEAHWEEGEFVVDKNEPARPIQGDSLLFFATFSESMDDSAYARLLGQGPLGTFPVNTIRWDSVAYPNDQWVGMVNTTSWDANRDKLAGERTLLLWTRDAVSLKPVDSDPSTSAYWDGTEWVGLENDQGNPAEYGDTHHTITIDPFISLHILFDHSGSVYQYWSNGAINVPHHLLDFMIADHVASGRNDIYRAGIFRYYAAPGSQHSTVELLQDLTTDLPGVQESMANLYQLGPADFCSNQQAPMEEALTYTTNAYCVPRRLLWMSDLQVNSGPYVDTQIAAWREAVGDTSNGTSTVLYAVTRDDTRGVEHTMADVIHDGGGVCFSVPFGTLYDDPPISERLYQMIQNDAVLYQLTEENPSSRESYTFTVDPLMSSIFALGIWTDWGLQFSPDEEMCWHTGGGAACCEDEDAPEKTTLTPGGEYQQHGAQRVGGDMPPVSVVQKRGGPESDRGGSRSTFRLYDASSTEIMASDTLGTNVFWYVEVDSLDAGEWTLTVSGGVPFSARVAGKSSVRIEMIGKKGVAAGGTEIVRVKVEGTTLSSPDWAVVAEDGSVYDEAFELYDDGAHGDESAGDNIWANSYTFPDSGAYRMLVRWNQGEYDCERTTASAVKVFWLPSFVFLTPASADTATGDYTITWSDSSLLAANIDLYYDPDDSWGGNEVSIAVGILEDDEEDSYAWNTWIDVDSGTYYVCAVISDGVNPDQVVYSTGTVTIEEGYQNGWPVQVGGQLEAAVCLLDLNGDDENEIVIGATDSLLYCFSHDGTTHHANFPFDCHGRIVSSAAAGYADNDGQPEIAVACRDTGLVWLISGDGVVESGWPVTVSEGTSGGMTLADVSGDDVPDLIWGSKNDSVYVYTGSGTRVTGWPQYLGADIDYGGACVADVDEDGGAEVLVPSIYVMYCFEANGTEKWTYDPAVDCRIYCRPSIGDLTGDGKLEVAFTSYWYTANSSRLYLLDAETGEEMPGWAGGKPVGMNVRSSVAIGYLEGAGGSGGLRAVIATGDGEVRAFTGTGVQLYNKELSGYGIWTTPIISDLNGDQDIEIAVGCNQRVYVLEAATGYMDTAYCRSVASDVKSTIAVGDLDNDGDLEMVAAEVDSVIHVWDLPGSIWADGQEWPQFQRDAGRTGLYTESVAPVAPELLSLEVVAPDSLKLMWRTVDQDIYGRDEAVTTYLIYREDAAYQDDWSTLAGEVAAPETTYTEWSGTVGDVDNNAYYRVKAEDMHGNHSALSSATYGEYELSTARTSKDRRKEKE